MTDKMQKFTKNTRAISKDGKGYFSTVDRFSIEDINFDGRLFAALGCGHALTGELFSDIHSDQRVVDKLATLVTRKSRYLIVIYRKGANRYNAALLMRMADGRLYEVAKVFANGPADAISWLGDIIRHPDFLDAVEIPAIKSFENPPKPVHKKSVAEWFVTAMLVVVIASGLGIFAKHIINKLF